ncbi:MAG: hypothetical protein PHR06_14825, partial [Candidatus Cloacimonetes bacterium]|nr:hypothetical protein [Candidatus Cloacimonadota bacterium]
LDLNKGISIENNYLNLPTKITYGDGRRIEIFYSAGGVKLRKNVYAANGDLTEAKDYVGGMVLKKNDIDDPIALFYQSHAAGRAYLTEHKKQK